MQKREQRNKSLQGDAMLRCNSYKLLTKNIVLKLRIKCENCSLRRRPSDWLHKSSVSKFHIWVHEVVSYKMKYNSRIKKSRIIDLGAGLLIGYLYVNEFTHEEE